MVSDRSKRWFWLIFSILLLGHVAAIGRLRLFPFVDLPNHLAEAQMYRVLTSDDPSPYAGRVASHVTFSTPNIAHIVLFARFESPDLACKLFLLLYVLLIPGLTMMLIRQAGGDTRLGVLSLLVLWNLNLSWGLIGIALALPPVLLFVWLFHFWREKGHWFLLFTMAGTGVLVYWAHLIMFLFVGLLVMCASSVDLWRGHWRRALPQIACLLPGTFLLLRHMVESPSFQGYSTSDFLKSYYLTEYIASIPSRLRGLLANDFIGLAGAEAGFWIGFILLLPVIIFLLAALWKSRSVTPVSGASLPAQFLAAALMCVVVLPSGIQGQGLLWERFTVLVALGVIIVLSLVTPTTWRSWASWLALLLTGICTLAWLHCFIAFGAASRGFDRQFLAVPEARTSTMVSFLDEIDFHNWPVFAHYVNYQIVWNRGLAPSKSLFYRFGPLRSTQSKRVFPEYVEWFADYIDLINFPVLFQRYRQFDYVLVHGDRPFALMTDEPSHECLRRSGSWAIFRKKRGL